MARAIARPALLRPGWIVATLFVLNPVWWVLGFGGLVWGLMCVPVWLWIARRPDVRRPPMVALFALFVVWSVVCATRIDRFTGFLSFAFRTSGYLTALGLAIYVYNERRVTRDGFVRFVAWLWVAAIVGGYLAFVLPNQRISPTLASVLLPSSIKQNDFVGNLVTPGFAQVQNLFGLPIPRPTTLFKFTNEWGGNVGLLTPFFVASFLYSAKRSERRFGTVMMFAAVPPIIVSVNRGLWISIGVIFVVLAVRSFLQGHTAPAKILGAAVVFIAFVLLFTPLGAVITGRLSESDVSTREGIYGEAWRGALESPFFGWGTTRPSTNPFSPAVGTHGQMWLVMFANGLVGLAIYVGWALSSAVGALRRTDRVSMMLACTILVGGIQMAFYSLVPVALAIVLIAIGLVNRPPDEQPALRVHRRSVAAHV